MKKAPAMQRFEDFNVHLAALESGLYAVTLYFRGEHSQGKMDVVEEILCSETFNRLDNMLMTTTDSVDLFLPGMEGIDETASEVAQVVSLQDWKEKCEAGEIDEEDCYTPPSFN